MAKRYELSDGQWRRIEKLLPGKLGDRGVTARDNLSAPERAGRTCRSAMASGRVCISASPAGPEPVSGSACSGA